MGPDQPEGRHRSGFLRFDPVQFAHHLQRLVPLARPRVRMRQRSEKERLPAVEEHGFLKFCDGRLVIALSHVSPGERQARVGIGRIQFQRLLPGRHCFFDPPDEEVGRARPGVDER